MRETIINKNLVLLKIWSGIIGALFFGILSYVFILDGSLNYFIILGSGIGAIMLISIVFCINWFFKKSLSNVFLHGLIGLVIGIIFGIFWTMITSIFTKWWDGWAFVIGISACILMGISGLIFAMICRWIIKQKINLIEGKLTISFLIILIVILCIIVPILIRG